MTPFGGASSIASAAATTDEKETEEEGVTTKQNAVSVADKISKTRISNILQSHRSCSPTWI